ncbi:bifunctional oligoribonuclease/PAP phosphatase NrnA, partial [Staphylococcus aureus]
MLKLSNFSKKGSMKMISTLNEIMKCIEDNDTIII